jgi:ABC-type antimicrobial peptide transport system permease subunit
MAAHSGGPTEFLAGMPCLERTFAATAILSLALGIGASVAIFTLADNLLLRPLPYREPGRLFGVQAHDPATFAAVPIVLIAVALSAAYLPARRASRLAPVEALKVD